MAKYLDQNGAKRLVDDIKTSQSALNTKINSEIVARENFATDATSSISALDTKIDDYVQTIAVDGTTLSITSGAGGEIFTGATSITAGVAGNVPAPGIGAENYFLRGDGTWASVSGGENSVTYTLSDHVSTIEGGVWTQEVDGTPKLRLRHGNYIYDFAYDTATLTPLENPPPATIEADTYFIDTTPMTVDGGLWYDTSDVYPLLKVREGNYVFSFKHDNALRVSGDPTLVSYLPFDYSASEDVCGNAWTIVGSPTLSNGALYLDGSSKYFKLTRQIGGRDFTIDFWLNSANAYQEWMSAFKLYDLTTTSDLDTLTITQYRGYLYFTLQNATNRVLTSNFQANQRYHVALVYRHSSNQVLAFLDGTLAHTESISIPQQSGDFYIGCWVANATPSNFFNGYIDHFRIFDGTARWTSDFTPPTASDYAL